MEDTDPLTPPDDHARLNAILDGLLDRRRRIAALQAEEAELLHAAQEFALARHDAFAADRDAPDDLPLRSVAAEIGAATLQSDRTVQARMGDAATLVARFPATLAALRAGLISRAHASVIVDAGGAIPTDDARDAYESAVLAVAERETVGRLRPVARRLADLAHPVPLDERHRTARRDRRVWVADRDDGMAELGLTGPAHLIHGAFDRLTQLARAVTDARRRPPAVDPASATTALAAANTTRPTTDGEPLDALFPADDGASPDTRRLDEVRCDVALDLLLSGHATSEASNASLPESASIRARIQVTIPLLTLVGADDRPADLAGYGPVDADTARRLAETAPGWDRLFTAPTGGTVLAVDRYRPSNEQRRLLRARDEHCRFPGCRQPTPRCDIDHTIAREHDGPTTVANLAHLCRRHHTLKHHSAWRVRQRPDGTLQWTSPAGRTYDDRPARSLAFEPAPF
ncbi:DUF222 domain-containing protein [Microbacterium hominis]|uniref:HNH endonuclease signature motif containing protein n=1 Tax=Microbacterium TaxID=33882 RepID=UPI00168A9B3C|nr:MULTISPECIES: HNH endonuclease signature motif containing protein [Microbacterium]QOC24426.1 DUF222 domain-containing protein [Microbacterium hominis]QOC28504.1 DUF222 domain-containing protein [Microbacterium hominis]QYF96293.1 HNH endonuclease [Microbacterium sp. PAMC21962]